MFRLNEAVRTAIRVKVLEGEAPEARANIPIGECRVSELSSNLPLGSPIQVRLSYGARAAYLNVAYGQRPRIDAADSDLTRGSPGEADARFEKAPS